MTAVAAYLAEKLRHKESTVYRALVHMRSVEKRRVVLPEERQILDRILVDDPHAIPTTITVPPHDPGGVQPQPEPGQPQPPEPHAQTATAGGAKTRRTDLLD
jgi:hypothetical protein